MLTKTADVLAQVRVEKSRGQEVRGKQCLVVGGEQCLVVRGKQGLVLIVQDILNRRGGFSHRFRPRKGTGGNVLTLVEPELSCGLHFILDFNYSNTLLITKYITVKT